MSTRRIFRKAYLVPEGGSCDDLKHFLLRPGWRKCTDCGLRRRKPGLELRILENGVHWLCCECRKKLIHHRWTEELDQNLTAMYNIGAERALLDALRQAAPELMPNAADTIRRAQQAIPAL